MMVLNFENNEVIAKKILLAGVNDEKNVFYLEILKINSKFFSF